MQFFSCSVSKDGKRLVYGMSLILRFILSFILLSIVLVLLFSFDISSYPELSLLGQINVILIPLLFFLATFYRYEICFDKEKRKIFTRHGLLFLYKQKTFEFEDLSGVEWRTYKTRALDLITPERVLFGFSLSGKRFLIDRDLTLAKAKHFLIVFRTFFPGSEEIIKSSGINI